EKAKESEPAAEKAASSGGSLFDLGGSEAPATDASEKAAGKGQESAPAAEEKAETSGGSLFDFPSPGQEAPTPAEKAQAEAVADEEPVTSAPENPPTAVEAKEAGTAPVPGTEIGSGSLFDLGPAEGEPADEKTGEPVGDQGDDADSVDHDGGAQDPTIEDEPRAEPTAAEAQSTAAAAPASSSDAAAEPAAGSTTAASSSIPEGGSLFDIKAAAQEAQGDAKPEAAPAPEETAEAKPAESPESEQPAESAESEQPAESAESEQPEEEKKPKPASSGEAHQPKTDADISGTGSLFDL
ncbi:MAG TPA: hypothetical protein VFK34_12740, partial [Marmoricola sp.]|nr:hypothetical protein [Marmoricola sp.]